MRKHSRQAWFSPDRPVSPLVIVLTIGALTTLAVWTLALAQFGQQLTATAAAAGT